LDTFQTICTLEDVSVSALAGAKKLNIINTKNKIRRTVVTTPKSYLRTLNHTIKPKLWQE
jgi:hypothetical protein